MPKDVTTQLDASVLRFFERTQRVFGRVDDLPAFLDLLAQTLIKTLEEVEPAHAAAAHLWGAAGLIARASFLRMAIIVGAFMLAATIVNLRMIPHPTWFAVTGIVLIIVMIPLAARLAGRFRARRVSD